MSGDSQARADSRPPDPFPRAAGPAVLRRLATSDLESFQAYRGDPALGRYQGWAAMSDGEARAFLSEMSTAAPFRRGRWFQLGIAQDGRPGLVGDVGIFLSDDGSHAQVGFTLRRESQGRGIATAAVRESLRLVFERTRAERAIAIADSRNLASIRLLERLGMRRIGSQSANFRGEPCIEHVFEITRRQSESDGRP